MEIPVLAESAGASPSRRQRGRRRPGGRPHRPGGVSSSAYVTRSTPGSGLQSSSGVRDEAQPQVEPARRRHLRLGGQPQHPHAGLPGAGDAPLHQRPADAEPAGGRVDHEHPEAGLVRRGRRLRVRAAGTGVRHRAEQPVVPCRRRRPARPSPPGRPRRAARRGSASRPGCTPPQVHPDRELADLFVLLGSGGPDQHRPRLGAGAGRIGGQLVDRLDPRVARVGVVVRRLASRPRRPGCSSPARRRSARPPRPG